MCTPVLNPVFNLSTKFTFSHDMEFQVHTLDWLESPNWSKFYCRIGLSFFFFGFTSRYDSSPSFPWIFSCETFLILILQKQKKGYGSWSRRKRWLRSCFSLLDGQEGRSGFMIFQCFHVVFACSGPQDTHLRVKSMNTRGLRNGAIELVKNESRKLKENGRKYVCFPLLKTDTFLVNCFIFHWDF
jgi:hypothetical protein